MTWLKNLWTHQKGFMLFLGLMFVFRSAVADWNYVPSSSMNPTLLAGDRVVVNKLAYSLRLPWTLQHLVRWDQPQAGDVITFDSPRDEVNLIKRVVAVGGDLVAMQDNVLLVNGQVMVRTLVDPHRSIGTELGVVDAEIWRERAGSVSHDTARLPAFNRFRDFEPVLVPAGELLVLGDSRDNSNDSRFIGMIDVNRVTGRAFRVAFSHDPNMLYLPRTQRWWLSLDSRS